MKKIYRDYLVATDLDGTLLNSNKMVSIHSLDYINKLMKKGLNFTIATSRPFSATSKYADVLNVDIPCVVSSGSMLYDFKKKEVVYSNNLDKRILPILLKEYGFKDIFVHSTKGSLLSQSCVRFKQFTAENPNFNPLIIEDCNLEEYDYSQITVLPGDIKGFIARYNEILKEFDLNIFECGNGGVAMINKGLSKASGIKLLANNLNVDMDKIFVFGDNYNDIEMISEFKNSFVMANGEEEIKKLATYITVDNNHNGVAFGLKKYLPKYII